MKKRIFSVLLIFATMLSLCVTMHSEEFSTPFSLCDSSSGWSCGRIDSGYGENSLACIVLSASNPGDIIISYNTPTAVDMGKYTHLEFDWYISDIRMFDHNTQTQLEVTSSGICDEEEASFSPGELGLVNGWNHVVLRLDNFAHLNRKNVDYFRFYILGLNIPDTDKLIISFDNFYFTDGLGVNDEPLSFGGNSSYTPPKPAEDTFNSLIAGDSDLNGFVTIADAMQVFGYVADKTSISTTGVLSADVGGTTGVSLIDAMLIFSYVAGHVTEFPKNPTLPKIKTETNIKGEHIVHTTYETLSPVVAVCDVVAFGAEGDGVTDDTKAFVYAFSYAEIQGGGTVFVPAGKYRINGNLSIPAGVTLCGDKPFSEDMKENSKAVGTVLMAYSGKNDTKPNAPAFITMGNGSGLKNVSIWYPEQTAENITPYPPTVYKAGTSMTMSNVYLINSYSGIVCDGGSNALENFEYIYGTPLKNGFLINNNFDICRTENFSFSPYYWVNCGLGQPQNQQLIRNFTYNNGVAFETQRIDWTYMLNISAEGYKYGFYTTKSSTGETNGHTYNFSFSDCMVGIYLEYLSPISYLFTKGTVQAQTPVKIGSSCNSVSFKDVKFNTSAESCIEGGGAVLSFDNCSFKTSAANSTAVNCPSVALSLTNCNFGSGFEKYIVAASSSKVINPSADNTLIQNDCQNMQLVFDAKQTSVQIADNTEYNKLCIMRPGADRLYQVEAEQHTDISDLLQQTIDTAYKNGGGIVYVKNGEYRLESPITVKQGVELRGSADSAHHASTPTTDFLTDYGKNNPDGRALITLEKYSGIRGFKVTYDKQGKTTDTFIPYSYTIRGNGSNIYIFAVSLTNSYLGADFYTNRCDNLYVRNLDGAPLKNGITVGGGSREMIVRDCHFNPHYNYISDIQNTWQYQLKNCEGFVVKNTKDLLMVQNFIFGASRGIVVDEGAGLYCIGHGTDGARISFEARGETDKKVTFINSQLVVIGSTESMEYINFDESFSGHIDLVQTNMWGNPDNAVVLKSTGSLRLCGGTIQNGGTLAVSTKGTNLIANNMMFFNTRLVFFVDSKSANVGIYGNQIAGDGNMLRDKNKIAWGSDI